MGHYVNYKCPKCNNSLSGGYRRTYLNADMGLPFVICSNCNSIIKTRKKPFSEFSNGKKALYWMKAFLTSIIYGPVIGFLSFMLLIYVIKWIGFADYTDFKGNTIYYCISFCVLAFIYLLWTSYENIRIVEDHYKSQNWTLEI
jgi:hypothetical protein